MRLLSMSHILGLFGLGLFSIASGDFLDVSGDDLTMMPRMEPDLNKYIPKRVKRNTDEVDKPNGKTPGWVENFQEALKSQAAEGTNDEQSPIGYSGLVDAYTEYEDGGIVESEIPGPEVNQDPPTDLNDPNKKVKRYSYKEGIIPEEPEGCGRPVCALIDSRPIRFASLCQLFTHMTNEGMYSRILHIQKGDCADAIEHNGENWPWSREPKDCRACQSNKICNREICVATKSDEGPTFAMTYENICQFLQKFHDATNEVTLHVGLGSCLNLFGMAPLFTEWFDIDEPCHYGDYEHVKQNMAYVGNFETSAPFRMCPKWNRKGFEVVTTQGQEKPDTQSVVIDIEEGKLQCQNKKQTVKPGPPNYWFHKKIQCMDYKVRSKCECLYGCYFQKEEWKKEGKVRIELPKTKTLFDECFWQPFVDTSTPDNGTWDEEIRGVIHRKNPKLTKHICGDNNIDSMYIDTRRIEDDTPWHETGELLTKNTPLFGALCINKNNHPQGKSCSDYKTRFCCKKDARPTWGKWDAWSECTKTCDGGTQFTTRKCKENKQSTETCHGNWKEYLETGSKKGEDRFLEFKKKTRKCNEKGCPKDATFEPWSDWKMCEKNCYRCKGPDGSRGCRNKWTQYRERTCSAAVNNGKTCPKKDNFWEKYEEERKCDIPKCPDPVWSEWTESECSVTCGVGMFTRKRRCVDRHNPAKEMKNYIDCNAAKETDFKQLEKCEKPRCAVAGGFGEWQAWGLCSVDCGPGGHMIRRRYCTNPMPEYGGANCTGEWEEKQDCSEGEWEENPMKNIPMWTEKCPINCAVSNWGEWSACSETCGKPNDRDLGTGTRLRYRHINPAKFGGKNCSEEMFDAKNMRQPTYCIHSESPKEVKDMVKNKTYIITFCPVDCVMTEWDINKQACPNCWGGDSNLNRSQAVTIPVFYTRRPDIYDKYGGKKCPSPSEWHKQSNCEEEGLADPDVVPDCNSKVDIPSTWSDWGKWGNCKGPCGKKGVMTRIRTCKTGLKDNEDTEKPPVVVDCDGPARETRDCPNHCGPTGWGKWEIGSCSLTCGKGVVIWTRVCRDSIKLELAERSICLNEESPQRKSEQCDMGPCKEDFEPRGYTGTPEPWQSWSDCSKSCGNGVQTRTRSVCNQEGEDCETEDITKPCSLKPCKKKYKKIIGKRCRRGQFRDRRGRCRNRRKGPRRNRNRRNRSRNGKHQNVTHQRKPSSG